MHVSADCQMNNHSLCDGELITSATACSCGCHTMSMPDLLNAHRDAVANRSFWENHGRHGDGNLDAAIERERVARAAVLSAARSR